MKKILIQVIVGILVLWGAYYIYFPVMHNMKNPMEYFKIATMPNFNFYHLENDTMHVSKGDLEPDMKTVIVFFHSGCHYCQNELTNISLALDEFKDVQFVFVSDEPFYIIKKFAIEIALYDKPNVHFAYDKRHRFLKWFGRMSTPTNYIYNKHFSLNKRIYGELSVDELHEVLD